jgi:hypothetical protein
VFLALNGGAVDKPNRDERVEELLSKLVDLVQRLERQEVLRRVR